MCTTYLSSNIIKRAVLSPPSNSLAKIEHFICCTVRCLNPWYSGKRTELRGLPRTSSEHLVKQIQKCLLKIRIKKYEEWLNVVSKCYCCIQNEYPLALLLHVRCHHTTFVVLSTLNKINFLLKPLPFFCAKDCFQDKGKVWGLALQSELKSFFTKKFNC